MRSMGIPEMFIVAGVLILIPLAALIVVYLVRRIEAKERLRAIEKGVAVPRTPSDPWARAANSRQSGIILVALGLGLFILFTAVVGASGSARESALGLRLGIGIGAIPFLLGLSLLLDYRLRVREMRQGSRPHLPPS